MTSPNPAAQEPIKPKLTLADFTCRLDAFHAIRGFSNYGQFLEQLGTMFDLNDLPVELFIELNVTSAAEPKPIPARAKRIFKMMDQYLEHPRNPDDIEIAAHFIAPYLQEIAEVLRTEIHRYIKTEEQHPEGNPPWLIPQFIYVLVMTGIAFNRRRTQQFVEAIKERSKSE